MKIKITILSIVLVLMTAVALLYRYQTINLKKELSSNKDQTRVILEQLAQYEELTGIDSLLINGEYSDAVQSYNNSTLLNSENKSVIPLRIAMAKKLMRLEAANYNAIPNNNMEEDSLAYELAAANATNQNDSLRFVLEKAKVKLSRVQRQLQEKSFGEYLEFKSNKGANIHYIGQVKNGKANGFGIALLDTGSRYEGEWKNNQRHGQGTFYWADGEYYKGHYAKDKRNGQGTYYWPNGDKYTGQWKEDKRSGSGQFIDGEGDIIAKGKWNNDKLVEADKKSRR